MAKIKRTVAFVLSLVFALALSCPVFALEPVWKNSDTGYGVYIDDSGDFLTDAEEKALEEVMIKVTKYCNAVFFTMGSAEEPNVVCKRYYLDNFGAYTDGVVLYIDPEWLYIYSEGKTYDVIGDKYSYTITDNVYTYCTPGNYLRCCVDAYAQIYDVLEGKSVPQPMKYAGNTILGLLIGFFICYLLVNRLSNLSEAGDEELVKASDHSCDLSGVSTILVSQTRSYCPRSRGGHGGHGGGGGHHGGGGGHRH